MWKRAAKLSKIHRSIAGPGVRQVLQLIKSEIPELRLHSVPSGTKCFDWEVPKEWSCKRATIKRLSGEVIVDTLNNPLHVVAHSVPKSGIVSVKDLKQRLHRSLECPNAIPYVTSYYKAEWGFCVTESQYNQLTDSHYDIQIDSTLHDGELNYGELSISGKTDKEILISTYICHPYMGNNESSGPAVAVELAKACAEAENYYSLRFVFIPETIGSIAFLSRNLADVKDRCIAGFNVTCVGDRLAYSFLGTKYGNTLADRAAYKAYEINGVTPTVYPWSARGSDERQYCWPLIDLPVVSMMRSIYNSYPEYHTSADNLEFISEAGLSESFKVIKSAIDVIQAERIPIAQTCGEPKLDKLNLYRKDTLTGATTDANKYLQVLTYCDGKNELSHVKSLSGLDDNDFENVVHTLESHKLIKFL